MTFAPDLAASPRSSATAHPVRSGCQPVSQGIAGTLRMLEEQLPVRRRIVREGDMVYQTGQRFMQLYIINSGMFKLMNSAADGREQVAALHFKGDWLGFDGIADAVHSCDAVAMDIGEVWTVRYDALLQRCTEVPALMTVLHAAMSHEMVRDRDFQIGLCTLPADARVAEFLRSWVNALDCRGQRTDQITLRMSRAEIGSYLGMTLESVSRALSRLAREDIIRFSGNGRRDVQIPDVNALTMFVQRCLPADEVLQ